MTKTLEDPRYKNLPVSHETWKRVCNIKFMTCARSVDEIVARLLDAHESDVTKQLSILMEGASYD